MDKRSGQTEGVLVSFDAPEGAPQSCGARNRIADCHQWMDRTNAPALLGQGSENRRGQRAAGVQNGSSFLPECLDLGEISSHILDLVVRRGEDYNIGRR